MVAIIQEYIATLPRQVDQVLGLLEQRDLDALRRTVHQIKGAGGGYGFMPITDAAATVERQIMAGAMVDAIAKQVRVLVDTIRSVENYDITNERHREAA